MQESIGVNVWIMHGSTLCWNQTFLLEELGCQGLNSRPLGYGGFDIPKS